MKRIIITFFTLLLVTSLNPSFAADNSGPSTTNESTSTESFESKLEKARKLVDQKKWKSAISELKKLSKTNKSNADVWNLLGFAASPYSGNDLVYAFGPIGTDALTSNSTWSMASKLTGGSSGGPWLSGFNSSTYVGKLSSVNSYKYGRDKTKMYGPKFSSKTRESFNLALIN
ncbi:MAG: hypothetical protein ACKOXS_02965 [Actinomycetes bacterium]